MPWSSSRVDPGPGTNSPYHSEAHGTLVGPRKALISQIAGNIKLILGNWSDASVFQRCERQWFPVRLFAGLLG